MSGYIKLFRQITDNEFYFAERFSKIMCWIDLLLLATHSGNTVNIRNNVRNIVIKLNPGELCYSIKKLSKRWKMNERTVSKILKMFQDREMITYETYKIKRAKITTLIKILKWNDFQKKNIKPTFNTVKTRKNTVQKNSINTSDLTDFEDNNTLQSTAQNTAQSTYNQECKRMLKNNSNYIKEITNDVLKIITSSFANIKNKQNPETSDYAEINKLLKCKEPDTFQYDGMDKVRKLLLIWKIIADNSEKIKAGKYFPYIKAVYETSSYYEYQNAINIPVIPVQRMEVLN